MTDKKFPDINTERLFDNPDHSISIYGSCVSRDMFGLGIENMCFVANQSLISTFSKPFDVSDNFVLNSFQNNWGQKLLLRDFHSDPDLHNLKTADTLIVDLISETYGVYERDGSAVTTSPWFRKIGGVEYAEHVGYRKLSPFHRDHWKMWCRSADAFLLGISGRYKNRILNCATSVIFYNDFTTNRITRTLMTNHLLKRKYDYLQRNGDFIRIDHPFWLMVGDANYPWGKGPRHYRRPYYTRLRDKIAAIVNQD